MRSKAITILVILMMIGWPVTVAGSAGAVSSTNPGLSDSPVEANFNEENNEQFTNASDDLIVWERSFLPLRADTTGAATEVENHDLNVIDNRTSGTDQLSANRPATAIYNKNQNISFNFGTVDGAFTKDYDNRSAQLIFASFEKNEQTSDVASADQLNEVVTPALDGDLAQLRTEADERNVSFNVTNTTLDKNGELSFDFNPETAGPHAVMVALPRSGGGFDTDSEGLLTLPGEATIMGVEAVMVQDSASTISPPDTIEPGEDLTLNPSTQLGGGDDINHSVLVYNEDTFLADSEETNLRLDEDFSSSLESEDIVVQHSIASVNGVGDMTSSGTFFGTSVSQRTVTGTVALADVVDQLSTRTDTTISRETTGSTVLDASGVVKPNAGADASLTVQTYGNWSEGTYRIIHVAENGTVEGVATTTDTIKISESTETDDDDDGRNRNRRSDNDDDDDDDDDDTLPTDDEGDVVPAPNPVTNVQGSAKVETSVNGQTVTVSINSAVAGDSVETRFDDETVNRDLEQTGAALEGVTKRFGSDGEFSADITYSAQNPSSTVPEPPSPQPPVGYINVNHNAPDTVLESVQFRFSIRKSTLEERGISQNSVSLYRYNEQSEEHEEYDAAVVSQNDDRVVFTADSPGLSVFAIGQSSDTVDDGTDDTGGDDSAGDNTGGDSTDGDSSGDSTGDDGTGGDDSPVGVVVLLIVLVIAVAVGIGLYQSQQD